MKNRLLPTAATFIALSSACATTQPNTERPQTSLANCPESWGERQECDDAAADVIARILVFQTQSAYMQCMEKSINAAVAPILKPRNTQTPPPAKPENCADLISVKRTAQVIDEVDPTLPKAVKENILRRFMQQTLEFVKSVTAASPKEER
ncbi:hypothetical protein COV82_01395 [Candidatus Peregrinibacteria bacterium CG11_big_fil_rev_8_21_14_0_20_46_8]|nr:MAG: hypothetical protein COV82_01395 [Candidatus Peregrinibacteria bacterium CG11_big_fil_rev_8_21_14_0_20_46_8]